MQQTALFKTTETQKQPDQPDGLIDIGNNYSIKRQSEKTIHIYYQDHLVKSTTINAAIDRRRMVVELVLECGVIKSRLAEALDISRQSIDTWIETFRKSGFEGLVNSYKGGIRKGRQENAQKLPVGNKARILEKERKQRKEDRPEQLALEFPEFRADELGEETDQPDIFNETYEFEVNRYAGSFIFWGIFQSCFGFMRQCSSYLGVKAIVVYLFAMMLIHQISSVEALKIVFKKEFGRIIGMKRLFSKPVLWPLIYGTCALKRSKDFIEGFFRSQARRGLVALYWLYIDGHFIPYYGKEKVQPGFYTQRDQMMPGRTEIFVHDFQGRIVFFELQEGKGDLKEMMRRMGGQWASEMGGMSPLIIADRECWGVEYFISLKGSRFVSWEKFSSSEELSAISEKSFGDIFMVNGKEYQVFEDKKTYSDNTGLSIELRRIVIWNKKTNRRVACVTFPEETENAETIARAMLGRWGSSENSFKHMQERFDMHYDPAKEANDISEKQSVKNPDHDALTKEMKSLKKELKKVEIKIGRLPITQNKDGSLRKNKQREILQDKRENIKAKIDACAIQLENCSKTIELTGTEGQFKKLGSEGKNLWDLAHTLVWNSRKKLSDIFLNYLPDHRDVLPVLDAVTTGHGWVKSTSSVIEIRLEPLDTPRYRAAQIQLCQYLTSQKIRLQNGKRLIYSVGGCPK